MEKRLALFLFVAFGLWIGYAYFLNWWNPPQPVAQKQPAAQVEGDAADKQPAADGTEDAAATDEDAAPSDVEAGAEQAEPEQSEPDQALPPAAAEGEDKQDAATPNTATAADQDKPAAAPAQRFPLIPITLGSADPRDGYHMQVTVNSAGAVVERIALNSPRYRDLEDLSGYLGCPDAMDDPEERGAVIAVAGRGTPAFKAGLRPGDIIQRIDSTPVRDSITLELALGRTRPNQLVAITYLRDGRQAVANARLTRRPLEVVRPEYSDPLSLVFTLNQFDKESLGPEQTELKGLNLKTGNWEVRDQSDTHVTFGWRVEDRRLDIIKRYSLEPVSKQNGPAPELKPGQVPAMIQNPGYHLVLDIEIQNLDDRPHTVAYQLDGPTGLPTEGEWYATKISHTWSAAGLRDVAVAFRQNGRVIPSMINCPQIAEAEELPVWQQEQPLVYIGVDAQYFSAILIPERADPNDVLFSKSMPLRVTSDRRLAMLVEEGKTRLTNTSCRVISERKELAANSEPFKQRFLLFAGPKKPSVLAKYGLDNDSLVYYGWFGVVSRPMLSVLHGFYRIVGNYGIAIVMLTILVRSCMFPLSRKQVVNAQRMQELQPEVKKLQEKYKGNMEQLSKAQRELFRQHGYNPFSGCLPALVQIPIFIGLYRSLSVDVELRQAPLLWEGIRWCSNLAAPDMLFRFSSIGLDFPFVISWLGPWFNILPIITVGLFVVQQKLFMPPPADEQARMQQNMMQVMMIMMGVLFFKVASGLCIYFIASSLWGLAERMFIPKPGATPASSRSVPVAASPSPGDGGGSKNGNASPSRRARNKRGQK